MDLETILHDVAEGKIGLNAAARMSAMTLPKLRSLLKDRDMVFLEFDEDTLQRELEAIDHRQAECSR